MNTNGKGSANAQGESEDFVEKRLIQKAQKGCMSSFEQLIFLYEDRIFHFIFKKTNDYHQSQDILQATFLRVYKNLGKFKENYKFSTWVYTIANRQVIDYLRTVKSTNTPTPSKKSALVLLIRKSSTANLMMISGIGYKPS